MTISLRISDEDTNLIKAYAAMHNVSVSELIRQSVMDRIEDEFDLAAWEKAHTEYLANPVTYSYDEVCKMLESED